MITLTPFFKTAIANGGPMKYRIEISEDNGISWQTIPSGADIISPLGTLSGETELEPFDFKGPDIELTAFNQDGYWTNSAKTGKLDTGLAVKMRILESPQSIANEWVQLIDGYIDLSSVVNYRTAFTCFFTVRGTLNILDSVLANFVLAGRPARYPHKFGGWLEIVEVDPSYPEGLYELKFDAGEQKISWDNGPGQSINTSSVLYLKGQTGNQIAVRNMRNQTDATALPQTSGTISQWIAVKVDHADANKKRAYQPNVSMPLSELKLNVYEYVDLNLDEVSSIPIKRPDANIVNYNCGFVNNAFERMQPVHVVGIDANRWLISLDGGVYTGNFVLTVTNDPYFKVQSFTRFDPSNLGSNAIIINSYRSSDMLYLLVEDAVERKHSYLNNTNQWYLYKYTLATMAFAGYNGGTGSILYKSFVGYSNNNFYAGIMTDATHAKINKIVSSDTAALAYTLLTDNFIPGVSMCPGVISLEQFYVCLSSFINTTDNTINTYLQIYDIKNNQSYSIMGDIDSPYEPNRYWQFGPVGIGKNNVIVDYGVTLINTLGVFILMGPIAYSDNLQNPLNSDDTKLYEVLINDPDASISMLSSKAVDWDKYISTGSYNTFYFPYVEYTAKAGDIVKWTSGANAGITKIISSITTIFSGTSAVLVRIVLTTNLLQPISGVANAQDTFEIYPGSMSLTNATYKYKTKNHSGINLIKESIITAGTIPQSTGFFVDESEAISFDDNSLYKNVPGGYPLAGDYNLDGTRILIATQDNLQVVDINQKTTPNQYPEVALADFEDKNLRDAVQEEAISANCHLMPSEHNKRLSLIYRGKAANPQFTILNTEYSEGPRATPYYDYDAVELNGKKAGMFTAGNRQREISLTAQTTPDAYSQSLAYDILKHIGSGDRTHEIQVVGRIELEPGDEGFVELENGKTKTIMLLGHNTDPETLGRNLIVRES